MRKCTKCQETKTESQFGIYKVIEGRKYFRGECKQCVVARTTQWRRENPDASARWYVENNWNMSLEEYRELLSTGCEVCGTLEQLVIDHDHYCCDKKTGCKSCIRGILCNRHNLAEGNLQGSIEEAYALIEYMKKKNRSERPS